MTKIIEMKKDAFLKKINDYAARKKESPTKLYITPASLAAIKVKFIFARTHEITLKPDDLSFFKKTLMVRTTPVQVTEADAGKTYYFSFCAPLMKELTKARIYAGRTAAEKLEALSLYLNTVKDGKIIFEIIPRVDVNTTDVTSARNEGERSASFTLEEGSSCSQSFIADASITDASVTDASVRDASVRDASVRDAGVRDAGVENTSIEDARVQGSVAGSNREEEEGRRVSREAAFLDLLEEGRRQVESQEMTIQGLKDKILLYENLAVQSDLKIRESKTKARESRRKTRERDLTINNLGQTLQTLQAENAQLRVQQAEALLQAQTLQAQVLQAENARVAALQEQALQAEAARVAALQVAPLQVAQNEETRGEGDQHHEGEDEEARDDDITNLIAGFDDQEIEASLHLSETIAQWNERLLQSRNELVTVRIFNSNNNRDEEQTLARFIAIAKLEREKAAHFATSANPWPKEAALAALQSDGYSDDLHCFSLYQSFPEELKKFVVLFAFWEAAHHNRFYRNALSTVLNGGQVPGNVGMSGSDPTDTLLKLLHYTDMTRILMGHYGYIAWNKFNMNMFFTQDENEARFQTDSSQASVSQASVPQTALPGEVAESGIDISRTTTESVLYM